MMISIWTDTLSNHSVPYIRHPDGPSFFHRRNYGSIDGDRLLSMGRSQRIGAIMAMVVPDCLMYLTSLQLRMSRFCPAERDFANEPAKR